MGPGFMAIVAAVLAFVTVAGLGLAFAGPSLGARTVRRTQLVTGGDKARAERASRARTNAPDARRKQIIQTLKEQDKQAKQASLTLDSRLRRAGLSITPKQFWIISAVVGLIAMPIPLVFHAPLFAAFGAAFIGGLGLPRWTVGLMGSRRVGKFTAAFSDAIDIIVRGIKSGLPVHDCLKIIGRESPEPLGEEFRRLMENIGMGMSVEQSLEKMYERMPTNELRFFTIVLNIQAKSGGNLAEALGNLSAVLRARKLMREKIKALSSEAKASAWIIGCLPPAVVLLISVTSPTYMQVMYTDPRGHLMLMGGATWMAMGVFVMTKMINFKF